MEKMYNYLYPISPELGRVQESTMVQAALDYGQITPHILVIDDEPRIRDACRMVLTSMGMTVDTASDGLEGLDKIEENHYDMLLLGPDDAKYLRI